MLSKKLFLSTIVLFVLLSSPLVVLVEAEPSWVIWSQTYGGADDEIAYSLLETSDGGYAIAGFTGAITAGNRYCWLVKTDSNGSVQWNQTYKNAWLDTAFSLVETSDGGYVLAGYTESFGNGKADFWLIKTDEYGNIPEFPLWALLLAMLVVVMAVAVIYRRILSKPNGGRRG